MLLTSSQMDQLQATLANLSGLDAELVDQCGPLIRGGRNDDAVARAFVVLEERLRSALGVHGGNCALRRNVSSQQSGAGRS